MRKILCCLVAVLVVTLILIPIFLFGCAGSNEIEDDILGRWRVIGIGGVPKPVSWIIIYEFAPNGQLIFQSMMEKSPKKGKYSIDGDTIMMEIEGEAKSWLIRLEDNEITLINGDSVIVLVRLEESR